MGFEEQRRVHNRDYALDLVHGDLIGHASVGIIGHNDVSTTTRVTISPGLTTANIDQSGLHSTAITVDVASEDANDTSDGSGLRTVRIFGLDSDGFEQGENIILNGQTEVASVLTYSAINGMRGITVGSGNTSAGNIWCGNGSFTSGIPATKYFAADAGHNKGLTAYYTVPTGKELIPKFLQASMVGSNKETDIHFETSANGSFWITENLIGLISGGVIQIQLTSTPTFPAGAHFRLTAESGGAGTEITMTVACELIEE